MATPALAYPATVFTNVKPVAVAVNTMSSRVFWATAKLSPVCEPVEMVPSPSIPVREGASVTGVPMAVKMLFGVADA